MLNDELSNILLCLPFFIIYSLMYLTGSLMVCVMVIIELIFIFYMVIIYPLATFIYLFFTLIFRRLKVLYLKLVRR